MDVYKKTEKNVKLFFSVLKSPPQRGRPIATRCFPGLSEQFRSGGKYEDHTTFPLP